MNTEEVRVSETYVSVITVPFHTPVPIVPRDVIAAHDSTFPDASTPSPYCPAEQLVPFAASAVAVDALPVTLPVKFPENAVDERSPVEGLNESLVDETFCPRVPVVPFTHVRYIVEFVEVSSVIAVRVVLPELPEIVV